MISEIGKIYEQLGKAIQEYEDDYGNTLFKGIPIKWDMAELTPNDLPPVCIIFSGKKWREAEIDCALERQLDIAITCTSEDVREITLNLTKYSEDLKKLIDKFSLTCNFEIRFLEGSDIAYLKNIKRDQESYKTSGTVFNSIIVLSYLLRYEL